ncbi:MAG: T9SS C-terminal target domain-containing protein [Bacteroidetes bacterium]|nr:T9SS C-terminal target domain-containing protein [Bacteroidota bacterium]
MNLNLLKKFKAAFATAIIFTNIAGVESQNALFFDGTDDRVTCGNDTSVQITGKLLTLEAWVYPTSFKTNPWDCNVICKEDNSANYGYMLRVGGSGQLNFGMGNGTSTWMERNSPSNVLVLNTWQHIAGTYDGTWMRLYVNGKVVDSASATSNISNTGSTIQLTIGDHTGSYQRRFQGKIDEVRVWKACRTTAEIQANMYNEFCGPQKGLRAYYKFNQGKAGLTNNTVTTLKDYSGYNNTGTLGSFALTGTTSNWVSGYGMKRNVVSTTETITACDRFNSPSGKIKVTVSGTYYDTLQTAFGCDSAIKYVVTIKKKTTSSMKAFDCKSFTSPSKTYTWTKSGTYLDYLKNSIGCDSVITIFLTIGAPMDSVSLVNCYSVKSPTGKYTYTQSGTYYDTLKSFRGCDSVLKVKVRILQATTNEISVAECYKFKSPSGKYTYTKPGTYYACSEYKSPSGNYTWTQSGEYYDTLVNYRGCDSIVTVKLTIWGPGRDTVDVKACRYFILPFTKVVATSTGSYTDVTKNFRGCDSLILYRVTIVNIDDYVTLNGSLLTARNSTGTYQWLNCTRSYQVIAGETGKQYIAKENHLFAVEITDGGCKDTSDCIQVTTASASALTSAGIWISPNPSKGQFVIHSTMNGSAKVRVFNAAGQLVSDDNTPSLNGYLMELKQPAGVYILRIETENGVVSQRIGISE